MCTQNPNQQEGSLQQLIDQITEVTGLDQNNARTVVYYAIATHGISEIQIFPILNFYGPAGTGKTTNLNILKELVHSPRIIDGQVSNPALRDALGSETTALLDEADGISERWLVNRFSRQSSNTFVKRDTGTGWSQQPMNLFGATAMHRRRPFKDPAILSRSIEIQTRRNQVEPFRREDFQPYQSLMKSLASKVPWQDFTESAGSRIDDTWQPLELVCKFADDSNEDWVTWAAGEKEKARQNLGEGQEDEPTILVFRALLAAAMPEGGPVRDRVKISEIVKITGELAEPTNPWQTGIILVSLGFEKTTRGGTRYCITGGLDKLKQVANALGLQDDLLDES
ncbi:MAG: hypothetical protein IH872_01885 [Chloroflexi bacterium]|nr:hypothetical protein [Chloroflexota bacterium]